MTMVISPERIPLMMDTDEIIRVGGTRVTLDMVVAAFNDGATAEEILQQYPFLDLADVYAVIGYYLQQRPEVEAYLQRRQVQVQAVREQNESRFDQRGVRDRLMTRRIRG